MSDQLQRLALLALIALVMAAGTLYQVVYLHVPPKIVRPGLPADMPPAQEMRFDSGGVTLAGRLYLPPGAPRAAVVIIHGSGDSRRDNGWYATFARHLLTMGHAVLLTDKRGSAPSGGDWRGASMDLLAQDARAAGAAMTAEVPGVPLVLAGVSQGGWVAALVAEEPGPYAAVLSLSGSAVRPAEQLVLEERNTMRDQIGLPDFLARALAPLTAWRIRTWVQPDFWAHLAGFYANEHWARSRVPAYLAYGALDEHDNVPVAESMRRLSELDNPNVRARVFPGVGHGFFDYADGAFSLTFLADLAAFLAALPD